MTVQKLYQSSTNNQSETINYQLFYQQMWFVQSENDDVNETQNDINDNNSTQQQQYQYVHPIYQFSLEKTGQLQWIILPSSGDKHIENLLKPFIDLYSPLVNKQLYSQRQSTNNLKNNINNKRLLLQEILLLNNINKRRNLEQNNTQNQNSTIQDQNSSVIYSYNQQEQSNTITLQSAQLQKKSNQDQNTQSFSNKQFKFIQDQSSSILAQSVSKSQLNIVAPQLQPNDQHQNININPSKEIKLQQNFTISYIYSKKIKKQNLGLMKKFMLEQQQNQGQRNESLSNNILLNFTVKQLEYYLLRYQKDKNTDNNNQLPFIYEDQNNQKTLQNQDPTENSTRRLLLPSSQKIQLYRKTQKIYKVMQSYPLGILLKYQTYILVIIQIKHDLTNIYKKIPKIKLDIGSILTIGEKMNKRISMLEKQTVLPPLQLSYTLKEVQKVMKGENRRLYLLQVDKCFHQYKYGNLSNIIQKSITNLGISSFNIVQRIKIQFDMIQTYKIVQKIIQSVLKGKKVIEDKIIEQIINKKSIQIQDTIKQIETYYQLNKNSSIIQFESMKSQIKTQIRQQYYTSIQQHNRTFHINEQTISKQLQEQIPKYLIEKYQNQEQSKLQQIIQFLQYVQNQIASYKDILYNNKQIHINNFYLSFNAYLGRYFNERNQYIQILLQKHNISQVYSHSKTFSNQYKNILTKFQNKTNTKIQQALIYVFNSQIDQINRIKDDSNSYFIYLNGTLNVPYKSMYRTYGCCPVWAPVDSYNYCIELSYHQLLIKTRDKVIAMKSKYNQDIDSLYNIVYQNTFLQRQEIISKIIDLDRFFSTKLSIITFQGDIRQIDNIINYNYTQLHRNHQISCNTSSLSQVSNHTLTALNDMKSIVILYKRRIHQILYKKYQKLHNNQIKDYINLQQMFTPSSYPNKQISQLHLNILNLSSIPNQVLQDIKQFKNNYTVEEFFNFNVKRSNKTGCYNDGRWNDERQNCSGALMVYLELYDKLISYQYYWAQLQNSIKNLSSLYNIKMNKVKQLSNNRCSLIFQNQFNQLIDSLMVLNNTSIKNLIQQSSNYNSQNDTLLIFINTISITQIKQFNITIIIFHNQLMQQWKLYLLQYNTYYISSLLLVKQFKEKINKLQYQQHLNYTMKVKKNIVMLWEQLGNKMVQKKEEYMRLIIGFAGNLSYYKQQMHSEQLYNTITIFNHTSFTPHYQDIFLQYQQKYNNSFLLINSLNFDLIELIVKATIINQTMYDTFQQFHEQIIKYNQTIQKVIQKVFSLQVEYAEGEMNKILQQIQLFDNKIFTHLFQQINQIINKLITYLSKSYIDNSQYNLIERKNTNNLKKYQSIYLQLEYSLNLSISRISSSFNHLLIFCSYSNIQTLLHLSQSISQSFSNFSTFYKKQLNKTKSLSKIIYQDYQQMKKVDMFMDGIVKNIKNQYNEMVKSINDKIINNKLQIEYKRKVQNLTFYVKLFKLPTSLLVNFEPIQATIQPIIQQINSNLALIKPQTLSKILRLNYIKLKLQKFKQISSSIKETLRQKFQCIDTSINVISNLEYFNLTYQIHDKIIRNVNVINEMLQFFQINRLQNISQIISDENMNDYTNIQSNTNFLLEYMQLLKKNYDLFKQNHLKLVKIFSALQNKSIPFFILTQIVKKIDNLRITQIYLKGKIQYQQNNRRLLQSSSQNLQGQIIQPGLMNQNLDDFTKILWQTNLFTKNYKLFNWLHPMPTSFGVFYIQFDLNLSLTIDFTVGIFRLRSIDANVSFAAALVTKTAFYYGLKNIIQIGIMAKGNLLKAVIKPRLYIQNIIPVQLVSSLLRLPQFQSLNHVTVWGQLYFTVYALHLDIYLFAKVVFFEIRWKKHQICFKFFRRRRCFNIGIPYIVIAYQTFQYKIAQIKVFQKEYLLKKISLYQFDYYIR